MRSASVVCDSLVLVEDGYEVAGMLLVHVLDPEITFFTPREKVKRVNGP